MVWKHRFSILTLLILLIIATGGCGRNSAGLKTAAGLSNTNDGGSFTDEDGSYPLDKNTLPTGNGSTQSNSSIPASNLTTPPNPGLTAPSLIVLPYSEVNSLMPAGTAPSDNGNNGAGWLYQATAAKRWGKNKGFHTCFIQEENGVAMQYALVCIPYGLGETLVVSFESLNQYVQGSGQKQVDYAPNGLVLRSAASRLCMARGALSGSIGEWNFSGNSLEVNCFSKSVGKHVGNVALSELQSYIGSADFAITPTWNPIKSLLGDSASSRYCRAKQGSKGGIYVEADFSGNLANVVCF